MSHAFFYLNTLQWIQRVGTGDSLGSQAIKNHSYSHSTYCKEFIIIMSQVMWSQFKNSLVMHIAAAFMGHSWVSMEGNYRNQTGKHCD